MTVFSGTCCYSEIDEPNLLLVKSAFNNEDRGWLMQETHGTQTAAVKLVAMPRQALQEEAHAAATRFRGSIIDPEPAEEPVEPRRVMLRVVIESKLDLGPSDHQSSRATASAEPVAAKRARSRRRS